MTHFNETADYWGDKAEKLIDHGNGRLTARSVKIFADGKNNAQRLRVVLNPFSRRPAVRRSCGTRTCLVTECVNAHDGASTAL